MCAIYWTACADVCYWTAHAAVCNRLCAIILCAIIIIDLPLQLCAFVRILI